MSLSLGIVGLPNVGKSTLFNALTKNDVLAANYPFATIEPNVGVVPLPDPRLARLAEIHGSAKILPAVVSFTDIAGIVKGASEGQGLGNKFLANIRDSDAICQVVRAFSDGDVVHVDGRVDPAEDIETINTELVLADMQTLENRIPRLEKEAKKDKSLAPQLATLLAAQELLDSGRTIFSAGAHLDRDHLRDSHLLTAKPFVYVFNVDDDALDDEVLRDKLAALVAPADFVILCAKMEAELAELDEAESAELLAEMGVAEPGLNALARVGFHTLGLQTYLTAGPEGVARLDGAAGRHRPAGRGRHPHRLRARVHQGRDRQLLRPRRRRRRWPRPRPGARCASRARSTSCRTATWWSSASTSDPLPGSSRSASGGPWHEAGRIGGDPGPWSTRTSRSRWICPTTGPPRRPRAGRRARRWSAGGCPSWWTTLCWSSPSWWATVCGTASRRCGSGWSGGAGGCGSRSMTAARWRRGSSHGTGRVSPAESGRGMIIVAGLAEAIEVREVEGDGKVVSASFPEHPACP